MESCGQEVLLLPYPVAKERATQGVGGVGRKEGSHWLNLKALESLNYRGVTESHWTVSSTFPFWKADARHKGEWIHIIKTPWLFSGGTESPI